MWTIGSWSVDRSKFLWNYVKLTEFVVEWIWKKIEKEGVRNDMDLSLAVRRKDMSFFKTGTRT